MPVSDNLKFIYIHIPKCAGSSVRRALQQAGATMTFEGAASEDQRRSFKIQWLHHFTAASLQPLVSRYAWKTYFKFAFVRNPWDLLVSFYHFHKMRVQSS